MLKRKNPEYQEFSQTGLAGPPAKRQTLGDITNNLFSDPKLTIVPRSPDKVIKRVVAKEDVYQFQPPNIKVCLFDNLFMNLLVYLFIYLINCLFIRQTNSSYFIEYHNPKPQEGRERVLSYANISSYKLHHY